MPIALSRQDLAEMTGTTLYTVSRLLSAWEGEGLVAGGRERAVRSRRRSGPVQFDRGHHVVSSHLVSTR